MGINVNVMLMEDQLGDFTMKAPWIELYKLYLTAFGKH